MDILSIEFWSEVLVHFTKLGPLGGILLAMVEAFFPPLPLSLFVTINVVAFGFGPGYVYSFVGTTIGSICVFFIIKKIGRGKIHQRIEKKQRLKNMFIWIKSKGFMPIFILLTFPFTPSILVCGLAALADVKNRDYIWATVLGKLVMVLSLSFIGFNVDAFFSKPLRSVLLICATLSISLIGKLVISRYEKHLHKKHENISAEEAVLGKKKEL
jgi:uncharacterized membrane protein YdjX (TVP38/TMEM64 family)